MYLPISFTIINDNNNQFYLNDIQYTIPNGNYNATTLSTAIMDLVADDEPSFTITFNNITNKYTFEDTTDFTINAESTCLYILGFDDEVSSSSLSLTSTYPIDLTGDNIVLMS